MPYNLMGVEELGEIWETGRSEYQLCEYAEDLDERKRYKGLIDICDDEKLNVYTKTNLSLRWHEKNIGYEPNTDKRSRIYTAETKRLRKNLYTYFRSKKRAKAKDIMWTCYKCSRQYLEGDGYRMTRQLTSGEMLGKDGKKKTKEAIDTLKEKLSCFVPCNIRAMNDYRERSVLAYLCSMSPPPFTIKFFKHKGIKINGDAYALSFLIQWIFRSRIRDGKPISVYIPCRRVRELLVGWLDGRNLQDPLAKP